MPIQRQIGPHASAVHSRRAAICRQTSLTAWPASACFGAKRICSSVNLDFFIASSPSCKDPEAPYSSSKWTPKSEVTFYVWKKRYANLGVLELRELRQLRDENARLKRLVADLTLDRHVLQEVIKKKI